VYKVPKIWTRIRNELSVVRYSGLARFRVNYPGTSVRGFHVPRLRG